MTWNNKIEQRSVPEPNSGCWLWLNSLTSSGYGKIYHEGKLWLAHRVSYLIHKGRIPKGKVVMHTCDNKVCVNPNHLKLGTHKENTHDMIDKGRGNLPGELNNNSKLNNIKVSEIRDLLKGGLFSQLEIAELYNVKQSTISLINLEKIWRS